MGKDKSDSIADWMGDEDITCKREAPDFYGMVGCCLTCPDKAPGCLCLDCKCRECRCYEKITPYIDEHGVLHEGRCNATHYNRIRYEKRLEVEKWQREDEKETHRIIERRNFREEAWK